VQSTPPLADAHDPYELVGHRTLGEPDNQPVLDAALMAWFWDQYAPASIDRSDPDLAPLLAPDVSGLPPAIVMTAGHDVLCDEGLEYAERLVEAGVRVRSRRFDDEMHGFSECPTCCPARLPALTTSPRS
jgi:acetyl esterase